MDTSWRTQRSPFAAVCPQSFRQWKHSRKQAPSCMDARLLRLTRCSNDTRFVIMPWWYNECTARKNQKRVLSKEVKQHCALRLFLSFSSRGVGCVMRQRPSASLVAGHTYLRTLNKSPYDTYARTIVPNKNKRTKSATMTV